MYIMYCMLVASCKVVVIRKVYDVTRAYCRINMSLSHIMEHVNAAISV